MRNFRLAAITAFVVLLSSCGGARIDGTLNGVAEADVVIKVLDINRYTVLDTVKTGKNCSYKYKVDIEKGQPEFVYIFYKETKVASLLLMSGDKVKVVSDTLGHYSVTGSDETEKLMSVERDEVEFINGFSSANARLEDLPAGSSEALALRRDIAKQYIAYYRSRVQYIMANPYSLTVIPVLYQTVGGVPVFSQATDALHFRRTCDSLKTVYPNSKYVKALEDEAVRRANILSLQSKFESAKELAFPDLEMPDIKGNKIKLSDIKAKLVLVYFWTAGAAEQKMFNIDLLKPLYDRNKDKGFEIYAVAMDTDKTAWANVVRNQNLQWINVCDGLGAGSIAAKLYNVPQIPMAYFIKDGKLLADPGVRDGNTLKSYIEKNLE